MPRPPQLPLQSPPELPSGLKDHPTVTDAYVYFPPLPDECTWCDTLVARIKVGGFVLGLPRSEIFPVVTPSVVQLHDLVQTLHTKKANAAWATKHAAFVTAAETKAAEAAVAAVDAMVSKGDVHCAIRVLESDWAKDKLALEVTAKLDNAKKALKTMRVRRPLFFSHPSALSPCTSILTSQDDAQAPSSVMAVSAAAGSKAAVIPTVNSAATLSAANLTAAVLGKSTAAQMVTPVANRKGAKAAARDQANASDTGTGTGNTTPTDSLGSSASAAHLASLVAKVASLEMQVNQGKQPVEPVQFPENETLDSFLQPLGEHVSMYAEQMLQQDLTLREVGTLTQNGTAEQNDYSLKVLMAAGVSVGAANAILRAVDTRRRQQLSANATLVVATRLTGGQHQQRNAPGSTRKELDSAFATAVPSTPNATSMPPPPPRAPAAASGAGSSSSNVTLAARADNSDAPLGGSSSAVESEAKAALVAAAAAAAAAKAVLASSARPCAHDILALVERRCVKGDGLCEDYAVLDCLGLLDHAKPCSLKWCPSKKEWVPEDVQEDTPTAHDLERAWRLRDQEVCYMENHGVDTDKKQHTMYLPSLDYRSKGTFQRGAYGDTRELPVKAAVLKVDIVSVIETKEQLNKERISIFRAGREDPISVADVIKRIQNPTDVPLVIIFNNGDMGPGGHFASGWYKGIFKNEDSWRADNDWLNLSKVPSYPAESEAGKEKEKEAQKAETAAAKDVKEVASSKGGYKCGKCGQPKKGHVCSGPSSEVSTQPPKQRVLRLWCTLIDAIVDRRAQNGKVAALGSGIVVARKGCGRPPGPKNNLASYALPVPNKSTTTELPVGKVEDWLEEGDAGEKGKGAFWKSDPPGDRAILITNVEDFKSTEDEAEQSCKEADELLGLGDIHHQTACFVDENRPGWKDEHVVVLNRDRTAGRLSVLSKEYERCDKEQIHVPSTLCRFEQGFAICIAHPLVPIVSFRFLGLQYQLPHHARQLRGL